MRKRFTIKRIIILLSIILVYSVMLCFISVLAKDAILNDLSYPNKPVLALSGPDQSTPVDVELSDEDGSRINIIDKLEKLEKKAGVDEYGIFSPVETKVSIVSANVPTEAEPITTTAPKTTPQPTTPKATVTSAPETTTTPSKETTQPTTEKSETTTTEKTEEVATEDVSIDDDDPDVSLEELDESSEEDNNISLEEMDDELGNDDLLSTFPSIFDDQLLTPPVFWSDNLYSTNSYRNEMLTIYDKASGRYVTDNAFDLVCEITYNEIGANVHEEAIKAQAVAVYTYIKYYEQKGEYASLSRKKDPPQKIIDCVNAVDGLAIYYDGEYILSSFSASSAGVTCASQNVWGGERPYLVSVPSAFDYLDSNNYGRVTTYTAEELKKKIESKTNIKLSNNYANWITILSYADGNYVDKIAIDGHTTAEVSGKERELTAHIFRTYILSIRSTCFTVSYSNGTFTFVTYGYGHGVGMPQVGADLYAKNAGYSFDQILHHYYTGVTIR